MQCNCCRYQWVKCGRKWGRRISLPIFAGPSRSNDQRSSLSSAPTQVVIERWYSLLLLGKFVPAVNLQRNNASSEKLLLAFSHAMPSLARSETSIIMASRTLLSTVINPSIFGLPRSSQYEILNDSALWLAIPLIATCDSLTFHAHFSTALSKTFTISP